VTRKVNPDWWTGGERSGRPLRHHLARHDIGTVFSYLKDRGFSWAAIASATGLGASRVSEIAHGRRVVTDYAVFERIADGLSIPRHYMGLSYAEGHSGQAGRGVVAGEVGPVDHRELLGAVASVAVGSFPNDITRWLPAPPPLQAPAVVTADDVATVQAVTTLHRRLDAAGGGGLFQSARGYVGWASSLLSARYESDEVGVKLRIVLADLNNLVGWVAHDLNQHDTARRYLTQSLVLARQTDSLPLLANGLYRLGRVSLHQGLPEDALHLFGLGLLAAQHSGCRISVAILHTNTTWAYAVLGAAERMKESLDRARREFDRVDLDTAPAWARFALDPADFRGMSAVTYTALARHRTTMGEHHEGRKYAELALAESHQAVALRKPGSGRSFAFDMISVAAASILAGEFGDAAKYGARAMTLAETEVRSARVRDRLADFWNLAAPFASRHSELAELATRLAALRAA
jgi:tetratricopeptide (TPR) repeat protein